jgi:Mg2+/citrate symporter
MKKVRTVLGALLVLSGVVFSILPGSILFVLGGLMMLAVDYPKARNALTWTQRRASLSARKLDSFLWNRKYK